MLCVCASGLAQGQGSGLPGRSAQADGAAGGGHGAAPEDCTSQSSTSPSAYCAGSAVNR